MGTKEKARDKAKAKVAKMKEKIARKAKGGAKVALALVALALLVTTGCTSAESQQPAKSATMNNEVRDSIIIIAAKAKIPAKGSTNAVIEVEGGNTPSVEILTLTQSLESTGSTDTFSQSSEQTPTTDIKPDVDVHYNDAMKNATDASRGVLESLMSGSASKVLELMASKQSGTVEVTKKDGTTATVECKDGQCSICTDCTPSASSASK